MKSATGKMPRLDLHCHLDGSLSPALVGRLLGREVSREELQVSPDCRNLAEYLEKFDLPLRGLQTEEHLALAAEDFMDSAVADKLDYVEVRFAPLLSCEEGLAASQVIEAVLSGMERGRRAHGIDYGVIVCAMRHHSREANERMLRTAREYLGEGVCAADLAGNEAAWPMSGFVELFREVEKLGMPFTIHAGECGSAKNIVEAVSCGAGRIGHGIAMSHHPDVMELCRKNRVGIEMCPVSNLQTRAVEDVSRYPMKEFLDAGLLVTVNTDNRTVSGTTIDGELRFVRENCGVTQEEMERMMRNAVEVSFADDSVKHRLLEGL